MHITHWTTIHSTENFESFHSFGLNENGTFRLEWF